MTNDKHKCSRCNHGYSSRIHRTRCRGMSLAQHHASKPRRQSSHIARGSWSVFDAAVPAWGIVADSDFPNDQRDEATS